MRTRTLLSVAVAGLLMVLVIPFASAERVKTTQSTKVMKRPGERSAVVTRVKKGRTLTVIAKQGRWMKVRVNGRTGWVARSTVASASAREVPRNTRRRPFVDGRSTRRGWSGEAPEDRVGEDAVEDDEDEEADEEPRPKKKKAKKAKRRVVEDEGDEDEDFEDEESSEDCEDEDCEEAAPEEPKERVVMVAVAKAKIRSKPSKKGRARSRAKKGARLVVLEEEKGWMLVEDQDGESGWIKKDEVWEPGARPQRAIRLDARLGFERLGQVFRSDGPATSPLANYDVAAASAALGVRGDLIQKYKANYLIGAELRFDAGKSTPGIRYQEGDAAANIPYSTYDLGLAAVGGYDFHHRTGAAVFGRVGYHYGMFAVANVSDFTKNLAKLPSETLSGVTIGVGAEAGKVTDKIGVRVSADYLAMGSRAQTKGLEDGGVSTAKALWAGLGLAYQWKPDMTLDVSYGYEWAKTVWSGAATGSMRGTGATDAARKDVTHGLQVGLAKSF